MVSCGKSIVAAFCFALAVVRGIQVTPMNSRAHGSVNTTNDHPLKLIMLDDTEVASRGSHCLDGSTPGYLYKSGTADDKWFFWFQGGSWCASEADCAEQLPLHAINEEMETLPLMETGDFSTYHHVYFPSCDYGLFLGDKSDPVDYQGTKLYFQGKRIVDHILSSLETDTSFASAKEVLISGGSGGGQTSYVIADYLAGVMPQSVQKFGAAPINGWYPEGEHEEIKYIYTLANMGSTVSSKCKEVFPGDDQYKCIIPSYSYTYATTPIYMTQLFDYTFKKNSTISASIKKPYIHCLKTPSSDCSQDDVDVLQEFLSAYTEELQGKPKFQGQGGFLSTCVDHVFYNDEDKFKQTTNNGVSVGDAVSAWWKDLGSVTASAKTYLPCTLGAPGSCQCEASCS